MAKSENIFTKAKAYQKQHPRTPWAECIQKVSKKSKVSGAKVAGKIKRKRSTNKEPKLVSSSVRHRGTISRIHRGTKILKEIDKLEAKAKEVSNKDLKHLYYVEINDLHKKLAKLKKSA